MKPIKKPKTHTVTSFKFDPGQTMKVSFGRSVQMSAGDTIRFNADLGVVLSRDADGSVIVGNEEDMGKNIVRCDNCGSYYCEGCL